MPTAAARNLTLAEAARIICRTENPSGADLDQVRRELETGTLKGKAKGANQWSVSAEDVAEYMAQRAMQSRLRQRSDAATAAGAALKAPRATMRDLEELQGVYHNIFKDYFLAVMLRRKVDRASQTFSRMVLAGQFGFLLALTVGGYAVLRSTFLPPPPAEQVAVTAWIAQNTGKHKVLRWFPTQTPADDDEDYVMVRVQYRYFTPGGKMVESDRTFRVEGRKVTPEEGDD